MPVEQSAIDYLLRRVRAEYHEMPGLRLTLTQAARLWSLDRSTCAALLDVLVSREFLAQTVDGSYVRADGGPSNGRRSGMGTPVGEPRTVQPQRTLCRAETPVPIGDAGARLPFSDEKPRVDRATG